MPPKKFLWFVQIKPLLWTLPINFRPVWDAVAVGVTCHGSDMHFGIPLTWVNYIWRFSTISSTLLFQIKESSLSKVRTSRNVFKPASLHWPWRTANHPTSTCCGSGFQTTAYLISEAVAAWAWMCLVQSSRWASTSVIPPTFPWSGAVTRRRSQAHSSTWSRWSRTTHLWPQGNISISGFPICPVVEAFVTICTKVKNNFDQSTHEMIYLERLPINKDL